MAPKGRDSCPKGQILWQNRVELDLRQAGRGDWLWSVAPVKVWLCFSKLLVKLLNGFPGVVLLLE